MISTQLARRRRPEEERPYFESYTQRGQRIHISPDPQGQFGWSVGLRHRPQMPSDEPKVVGLSLVTTIHDELLPLLDERGQSLSRRDGRRFVVII